MNIAQQIIIALPLTLISGVWAWRQINAVRTQAALSAGRALVLEFCTPIVEDGDEKEDIRRIASGLIRLSLNEPLLESITRSMVKGLLPTKHRGQRPKATDEVNEQSLSVSVRIISLMSLAYHPLHGSDYRNLLHKLKERLPEGAHLQAASSIKPPKPLKDEAKMVSNALELSACNGY